MKKCKWYWTLLAISLIVVTVSAGGCTTSSQQASGEPVPPSVSASGDDKVADVPAAYPPVINYFVATPETISAGQSVTLSWDISGATAVTIDPAIDSTGSSSTESGIEQVAPTSTTSYTLTAANEAGSSSTAVTVTVKPTYDTTIGCDPVSGRNQEIDFAWEQLCLSSQYQLQIARDPAFTLVVLDTGAIAPASSTSPAAYYPAGGAIAAPAAMGSAIAPSSVLEAGHTYYWRVRVRQAATGQDILSPWSEVGSFTVKSGLPTNTPCYGIQLLCPNNNCIGCPVTPASFSWSPVKEATKYQFVLAKDASMTDIIIEAEVPASAFEYDGTLDYSASYFWRVMAIEPVPGDWSATFSFHTTSAPEVPPPPSPPESSPTPMWARAVISIGAILVIVTLVFVFKTRKRSAET